MDLWQFYVQIRDNLLGRNIAWFVFFQSCAQFIRIQSKIPFFLLILLRKSDPNPVNALLLYANNLRNNKSVKTKDTN